MQFNHFLWGMHFNTLLRIQLNLYQSKHISKKHGLIPEQKQLTELTWLLKTFSSTVDSLQKTHDTIL